MTAMQKNFIKEMGDTLPYTNEELMHSMRIHYNNPTLTERLASLHKAKVKLLKADENPWFVEMIAYGITETDIKIVREYIKFHKNKDDKALKEYKASGRGIYMNSHCYSLLLPNSSGYAGCHSIVNIGG